MNNITAEFNRSIAPTAIENLKVGDMFESKVKLQQAIIEWSIKHGVSFMPVKTNKFCYTTTCASIKSKRMLVEMCACGDYVPLFLRVHVDTLRLNFM